MMMMDRIAIAGALGIVICTMFMAYMWLFRKPVYERIEADVFKDRLETTDPPRIHNAAIAATAEAVQEYAVSGKVKRVPFRERKKELRENARTQRRKMEEWREDE